MKIAITVETNSPEEAQKILAKLGSTTTIPVNSNSGIVNIPASEAVPHFIGKNVPSPVHVQPVAAVEDEEEDDVPDVTGVIDKNGLPWDERIHSSNRKQSAKGIWVKRKGVDQATVDTVTAELRARSGNTFPHPIALAPANVPQFPAPVAQPPQFAPPVQQQTIGDLFTKLQQLFAEKKADNNYLISITNRLSQAFNVQLPSINDIANRPDMIAYAFQIIQQDGK